jgi:ABC-type multidrug transport system fused ATPase/permease subunit
LDRRQKKAALLLLPLILLGIGLETISVGMVLPTLGLFSGDYQEVMGTWMSKMLIYVQKAAGDNAMPVMAFILMTLFMIRGAVMLIVSWVREKVIANIRSETSKKLLSTYVGQEYSFHLRQNSSVLVRNVITEATKFSSLLNQSFIFIADLLVVFALVALIFYVSPVGTLATFLLFGAVWVLFFLLVGKKMERWGKDRQVSDGLRFQHCRQALTAIKEVKLFGREREFVQLYDPHNQTSAKMAQYKSFTKGIPRVMFEIVAIVAVFCIILIQFVVAQSSSGLLPKLGLFAIAAFRILPSANRLAASYNMLKFGVAVVDLVYDDLHMPICASAAKVTPMNFQKDIQVDCVCFRYASDKKPVLSDINFTIHKNETVGIVGHSGSGKSTLVDLILGLLPPHKGQILVDGQSIQNNMRGWQLHVGYVPQDVMLSDDTLAANIAFGVPAAEANMDEVKRAVDESNLSELVQSDTMGMRMPLGENGAKLSGGQRQRVGIARALYRNPDVLVLDEATSALDLNTEQRIVQTLSNMKGTKTIIIVSHRYSSLKTCDRIFSIENGCMIEEDANYIPPKLSVTGNETN